MANSYIKLSISLFIMVFISINELKANPGPEFSSLRSLLSTREHEPKMYLPMSALLGSDLSILISAPGAKKIRIFGSTEPGESLVDGKLLKVGPNYSEIGSESNSRAEFIIKLDPEKFAELVNKFYYFDSLITYADGSTRNANFYGSNAAYSNINAVKVSAISKDSGLENMARTMMPGFFNQTPRF